MEVFEILILVASVIGGLVIYFIKLETKITRNKTDLTWVKKLVDRRQEPRE